jgi:hypothetical protein
MKLTLKAVQGFCTVLIEQKLSFIEYISNFELTILSSWNENITKWNFILSVIVKKLITKTKKKRLKECFNDQQT